MPGLFGIVTPQQSVDVPRFLDSTIQKMSHQTWYIADRWINPDKTVGLGRLGIGIFNQEPQPAIQADDQVILFLCGELYRAQKLSQHLISQGAQPRNTSHPELILCAYQVYGPDFARHLEGAFFSAIFDRAKNRLILANDRFGLYPHYYSFRGGQIAFAPEIKGVVEAPFVPRKLDISAACEYFRFQQILGEKTFHEDVKLFPYGSTAIYEMAREALTIQRYWDWDQVPYRPEATFEEAVEETGSLLQGAVRRLSEGDLRIGVFLSGGLDSRTLLGFIPPGTTRPISATFGARNSRDVVYAAQIAQATGSQHYWFDISDGCWVQDYVDLHLKLTEGFHSWIHMHGITVLKDLRPVMDVNLTGWDGGTVMGHVDHINPVYNYPVDLWTVFLQTYHFFNQAYTWPGLTDAEERLLFTPEFGKQAIGRAFDSMLAEMTRFWQFRQEYAAEYFYVVNHCWRMTQQMITTTRYALEARFPFWDYQLIDFVYSLKPHIRRDQLMFRTLITRRLPRLARIPYDKKEYLPSVNPLVHGTHMLAVRTLKRLGLFPKRPSLYADYENFLRHELRPWAERILYDPRTEQRGLFDPAFVRSLMNRHLAGHEEWILGKIAPLITFEMVLREFFD
jgi:asparagine synthase (glutamine-hydrolysing)